MQVLTVKLPNECIGPTSAYTCECLKSKMFKFQSFIKGVLRCILCYVCHVCVYFGNACSLVCTP